MKVVENYIRFPAVHENSLVLKFEMPAPQFFLFWLKFLQDFSQYILHSEYAISKQRAVKVDPG